MPFSSLLPLANIILKILTGASWNFKMAPNLAKKSHPRVYCIIIKKECFKNWLSNWQIMGFIKTSLRFSFNPHNISWTRQERSSIRIEDRVSGPSINKKVNFLTRHIKVYTRFFNRGGNAGVGWDQFDPYAPSVLKCCHGLRWRPLSTLGMGGSLPSSARDQGLHFCTWCMALEMD